MGFVLAFRGEGHLWGRFIGFVLILLCSLPDTPAKIQSRIERMDTLIAEGPPADLTLPDKRLHSDHWGRSQTPKPDLHNRAAN
jgi:hypothetical protein